MGFNSGFKGLSKTSEVYRVLMLRSEFVWVVTVS